MHQHFPTFTVTLDGIMMSGVSLTKAASRYLSPEILRYIRRTEELLAKVKPEDWNNRIPHAANNVPILAQAKMMAALASPQPYPPLHKRGEQALSKDISGDFSSDEEDNSGYDGYDGYDTSDYGSDSGDDSGDDSDSDFNAEHPRWPAGDPDGRGGEFRPKDGEDGTGEYQVAQRTDVATDATPANNQASVTIHSRTNITINNPDGSSETRTGGSASWRNNNASNIISGDFADDHGAIGDNHGFAVFPDQATGDAASAALLGTSGYAGLTIDEAIARRSPPNENDTATVQQNVRDIGGFTGNEIVGQLNQEQMSRLVNAIKQSEGYHEGTVTQTPAGGN